VLPFALERADKRTFVAQMIDGIREAVRNGYYKPGDILPTLDRLATQLKVSIRVPREALKALQAEELVVTRPRVGTVVLAGKERLWRGQVVCITNAGSDASYSPNVTIGEVRARMVRAGYLFSRVTVPQDQKGRSDLSLLENALSGSVALAILMDEDPAVARLLKRRRVPYISCYGERAKRTGCVGRVTSDYQNALSDFVLQCCTAGVRNVLEVNFQEQYSIRTADALMSVGIQVETWIIPPEAGCGYLEGVERGTMAAFLERFGKPKAKLPDVIVFTDDFMARGGLVALLKLGVRIPSDVRIVSFANRGFCPVLPVSLSVFESDPVANGRVYADYAIAFLRGVPVPPCATVAYRFVQGDTFP